VTVGNTARIFEASDGGYWLETPAYNADYIADLKGELPNGARRWNGELGLWWVHPEFFPMARQIVERHYVLTDCPALPDGAGAWATLWLRPGAPVEVIRAVYRALARLHHPDVGGDSATMQRINAAYERLTGAGG